MENGWKTDVDYHWKVLKFANSSRRSLTGSYTLQQRKIGFLAYAHFPPVFIDQAGSSNLMLTRERDDPVQLDRGLETANTH